MSYASIRVLAHHRGNALLALLYAIRLRTHQFIASALPEPQAALLSGILLGSDEGIPRTLMDQFGRAGTAHIIAISGFNIALVSAALVKVSSRFLQRYVALAVSVAAIALYAILVGAEPVSYTHLRAHETVLDLVCRLLLEKKNNYTLHTLNTNDQ